jgi:membrane protease YdiL (CAAX protease family)
MFFIRPDNYLRMEYRKMESVSDKQYSLAKILWIWALVTIPMPLLAWIAGPALFPRLPIHPGLVHWMLMILGMIWQFVVSLIILNQELGTLRWEAIRQRTWLNLPRDPKTGEERGRLFWWLLPCLLFSALIGMGIGGYLDAPLTWLFPALKAPAYTDISQLVDPQFKGQWWIFGVALLSLVLNYFLGEEFIFRGILLPKMKGVFGKWDWMANAVLFGLYHLHKPWQIPSIMVSSLAITWPARRFRSNWMAVIVHGVEGFFIFIVLGVILGLIP